MTTVIGFIEATLALCGEWENGDRLPPGDEIVSKLLGEIGIFDQEIRSLDLSDLVGARLAAPDALMLLASLKNRIQAIALG